MNKPTIMSNEYWTKYLTRRLELISQTLGKKAEEYARNNDRMHNFNRAMVRGEVKTREEAIAAMALKHETSIADMRDDLKLRILPTKAMVEEKFGDAINYLLLEEASFLHTIDTHNGYKSEASSLQPISACDAGLWEKHRLQNEDYMHPVEDGSVLREIHQSEDGPEALI